MSHPAEAFRRARLPLLAALLFGLLIGAACDDDDETATPNETANEGATGTATVTETPGQGPAGGRPAADGRAAYDEALALALEAEELGSEAPADLIAEWNIDVTPDGAGLPEGSGTAATGAEIYAVECAACHGPEGQGGIGPQLVSEEPGAWEPGDPVTIGSWWPYATTVYDYIRRAMPFFEPGSLSDDEVYALTAFLLAENEIIDPEQEMNQETLPQVEMPAQDLFIECWPDLCYDEYGRDGAGDGAGAEAGDGAEAAEEDAAGDAEE